MLDTTYESEMWDESYDDEDWDDEEFEALAEDFDDEDYAEFIGAFLPGTLKALDPIGAAIGAATGVGKRKGGRRVPTARGGRYYRPPTPKRYVTHPELQASLSTVKREIGKNASGIKAVESKANANRSRLNQQNAINVRQGRQIRSARKSVDQLAQTQMLMQLLARSEDVTVVSDSSGTVAAGARLQIDREFDPITLLLPTLLMGDSKGGSGFSNPLLLLALMR